MDETTNQLEEAATLESSNTEAPAAPAFTCQWKRDFVLLACKGLPFYAEHQGKLYCVLHYPSIEKKSKFRIAFQEKLDSQDFNFRGVWFPEEVDFSGFEFNDTADFSYAKFSAKAVFSYAKFSVISFTGARFSTGADFRAARFSAGASFSSAEFSAEAVFFSAEFSAAANFFSAEFSAEADFGYAEFSAEADFHAAQFSAAANFGYAKFGDKVDFERAGFLENAFLHLQKAETEKPERVYFHTVTLRPHWFVDIRSDIKGFKFTNVKWRYKPRRWMTWGAGVKSAIRELKELNEPETSNLHVYSLLSDACRQLALIEEEKHRYDEAADLRYWAMRATRLEKKAHWQFWRLDWFYWLASGYGERILRALGVLVGIWFLFALLYTQVGFVRWEPKATSESEIANLQRDEVGQPLGFRRAMTYSFSVMALQKPDPRPATNTAHALVTFETILAPLQAALLALAIRRRFMR